MYLHYIKLLFEIKSWDFILEESHQLKQEILAKDTTPILSNPTSNYNDKIDLLALPVSTP